MILSCGCGKTTVQTPPQPDPAPQPPAGESSE